ncbi:HlyD family secretion protein [Bradyrhizobium sp. USDA 4369]
MKSNSLIPAMLGALVYFQPIGKIDGAEADAGKERTQALVTVSAVRYAAFTGSMTLTGSLVAREEVLVGPEIEGLRIVEVRAEEGEFVKRGQALARLSRDKLDAQLDQNRANLARSDALIEQAKMLIAEMQAVDNQATADFERTERLRESGAASASTFDQRQATARSSRAKVASARSGLLAAEAEQGALLAQRRELELQLAHTEISSPSDGLVSRRSARVGALASGAGEPLFRIATNGEVELEAEALAERLPELATGMPVRVEIPGAGLRLGTIRLISTEVEKNTRLGHVRIFLGADPALHIGSFGRGVVEIWAKRVLAVPASAVLYGKDGPVVQVVKDATVRTRAVHPGLLSGGMLEIRAGLTEGELVVVRAGAFLHDGESIRMVVVEDRSTPHGGVLD